MPSFATNVVFTTGLDPASLAIADFNGDGRPDLAVADRNSNAVSVLLNTTIAGAPAPSFALKQDFIPGNSPEQVTVGDINGDGKPDLILADYDAYGVSVLLNTTAPGATTLNFGSKVEVQTTGEGTSAAIGDFNGDGRSDIVALTTRSATSALVMLNTPEVITVPLATGTIIESDPQPTAQFSTPSETVASSAGTFSITVTLSAASGVNTTIPFMLGGTAAAGTDYSGVTASPLVIAAGQASATITGTLIADPGASKTLTFTLNTPRNATLGATTTNTLTITEPAVGNPVPTLTSISPPAVLVGSPATLITLTGTNFISGSIVDFNGVAIATTFGNPTLLTAVIPAGDLTSAGTDPIIVVNPGPGGGASAAQTFTVTNPAPTLASISPNPVLVGSGATIITLIGDNFVKSSISPTSGPIPGSTADFNGTPVTTTFVSVTQLTALIPASDLATAGTDSITVVTPGPGGGTSAPKTFTVNNPVPILTNISPTSAMVGGPATPITLTGMLFISSSTADFNGTPIATTFVSATQLTAVIPASDLAAAGTDSITVVTPSPGGGTSAPVSFAVNNPAPILTSITPTSATVGDPATPITLTGTGFISSSTADFNGTPIATTFVSATQLTAVIPVSDLAAAGTDSVTVVTPGPGGGPSAPQTFTVNFVTLQISDGSVVEPGPSGTANLIFTVTRTGNTASQVTVGYTTVDGTAKAGRDYQAQTGTTTFASGSATATISIPVFDNGVFNNPNLTFSVVLTGVTSVIGNPVGFVAHKDFAIGNGAAAVAVGDVNGDGLPDLVVANRRDNTVSVLLNTTAKGATTPTFATTASFAVGHSPDAVAIADLNGDGKPDVVVANSNSSYVSVLMNKTAPGATMPTFAAQQPVVFGTGYDPTSVAVADVNGDGKPDLVVTYTNFDGTHDGVAVLLNKTAANSSPFVFAAPIPVTIARFAIPRSVTVVDLNGDGKPDLIVTYGTSNNVAVYSQHYDDANRPDLRSCTQTCAPLMDGVLSP